MLLSLTIMRRLFRAHINQKPGEEAKFHKFNAEICGFLQEASRDDFTRITVEGLRVAGSFLNTLRSNATGAIDVKYQEAGISSDFFDVMYEKLENPQLPGSVKQQSIISMASMVSACHPDLSQ